MTRHWNTKGRSTYTVYTRAVLRPPLASPPHCCRRRPFMWLPVIGMSGGGLRNNHQLRRSFDVVEVGCWWLLPNPAVSRNKTHSLSLLYYTCCLVAQCESMKWRNLLVVVEETYRCRWFLQPGCDETEFYLSHLLLFPVSVCVWGESGASIWATVYNAPLIGLSSVVLCCTVLLLRGKWYGPRLPTRGQWHTGFQTPTDTDRPTQGEQTDRQVEWHRGMDGALLSIIP